MGSKLEVQQRENAWLEGHDADLAACKRNVHIAATISELTHD